MNSTEAEWGTGFRVSAKFMLDLITNEEFEHYLNEGEEYLNELNFG